jgi:hypothetical protein
MASLWSNRGTKERYRQEPACAKHVMENRCDHMIGMCGTQNNILSRLIAGSKEIYSAGAERPLPSYVDKTALPSVFTRHLPLKPQMADGTLWRRAHRGWLLAEDIWHHAHRGRKYCNRLWRTSFLRPDQDFTAGRHNHPRAGVTPRKIKKPLFTSHRSSPRQQWKP